MNRSAADVEAEVEASRTELDRNVEALKQKMTPGQLFDEAARMMGGTGQQVASKFADQAKDNPMPLAVMGLGLAWLMMSNNRGRASAPVYPLSGEPRSFASSSGVADGGLKDKVQAAGEKASDLLGAAKDGLARATASVGEGGRSAMDNLGSVAGSAKERAGQVGRQAQRTFLDTLDSEPLLIAGLGLLVGAAVGAALPHTAAEDQLMGEARDQVVTKGKTLAESGLQQASSAAQAAYGGVKAELQQGDGDLEERVESAARSGVLAARDELQRPER